ncbi:metal ion ABC transporter substrate-binding protein [Algoriphagus kandeliae]|uniref:Metal ion ABC transporter substrate-binding protein n=1 Tax=Algoriphagus kandeliae TaxID=2562278 RepID=A0A4Y9R148_9BACT|nr:zinc ABC transporter substrate-binding protein [Algoriphagus kandeliae]TFV97632.1 metal ion ABC transporter substrate-binding protein [Algoriphagus kandeliae]
MRKIVLVIFLILGLFSCKKSSPDTREKPMIVATTSILADAISEIVGDLADVQPLMPAGVDPHLYKASVRDLDLLTNANLVVYHGLFLEGKMTEIFEKLAYSQNLINMSEDLPESKLLRSGPEAHSVDPHIWFDVQLWEMALDNTVEKLIKWKPEWEKQIRENWKAYQIQLQALNAYADKVTGELVSSGQALVTAHDAFAYFGKAYDIEVRGLQGLSTLSEPGLRDLGNLVQFIIDRNIKAVFAEQTISPRALNALVQACEKRNHPIQLAGPLFTDSLDAPNTEAGTYIGMVQTNLNTIHQALLP